MGIEIIQAGEYEKLSEIYYVEHSRYKFTFMLSKIQGDDPELTILEGIGDAVDRMPHEALELEEFECEYYRDGYWVVETEIVARDYGLSAIGIELISRWCGEVFHYEDLPFQIDEILIDKSLFTYKTLIKFDSKSQQVVVIRLTDVE